jgi:hypothetical protein
MSMKVTQPYFHESHLSFAAFCSRIGCPIVGLSDCRIVGLSDCGWVVAVRVCMRARRIAGLFIFLLLYFHRCTCNDNGDTK